jgi:hypothetical protein
MAALSRHRYRRSLRDLTGGQDHQITWPQLADHRSLISAREERCVIVASRPQATHREPIRG